MKKYLIKIIWVILPIFASISLHSNYDSNFYEDYEEDEIKIFEYENYEDPTFFSSDPETQNNYEIGLQIERELEMDFEKVEQAQTCNEDCRKQNCVPLYLENLDSTKYYKCAINCRRQCYNL